MRIIYDKKKLVKEMQPLGTNTLHFLRSAIYCTTIRDFLQFSSYLFFIAGIFLLTALLSYGFGLESSGECLKIVLAGFLFYLLPCTVEIVIAGIVFLAEWIRSFT